MKIKKPSPKLIKKWRKHEEKEFPKLYTKEFFRNEYDQWNSNERSKFRDEVVHRFVVADVCWYLSKKYGVLHHSEKD